MTTFNDEDGRFKEKWNIYLKINADKISEVFYYLSEKGPYFRDPGLTLLRPQSPRSVLLTPNFGSMPKIEIF